jgi:RsiW-degrading membrane proteinase PrsW (M82 family)
MAEYMVVPSELFLKAPLGLLPVMVFLFVLLYLDSFKLVKFRFVVWVILGGALAALTAYFANGLLIAALQMEFMDYTRFIAPIVEESLKGLIVVYLFRSNRIGFLVDSAIVGFAAGAGFALVENLYYLHLVPDASVAVWTIRGFGTALMHGGVTAIFAIIAETLTARQTRPSFYLYLPGLLLAAVLHAVFNQFPVSPVFSTLATMMALPLILMMVFRRSVSVMHEWLEVDFDANEELFATIRAGKLTRSKEGQFLLNLRDRFDGLVMADMICYIRLHVELAMRSKSMLMAREYGMDVGVDREIRDKFDELHALERNIGKAGILAIWPYLNMSRKELWQLYLLEEQ